MVHYIVYYEPVDVIARDREEAIRKVKNIAPSIARVLPAKVSVTIEKPVE